MTERQTKSVLVIDDVEDNLLLIEFLLENRGYTVSTAESGNAALAHLAAAIIQPDLIILDLMMPEMDGYEVINYLRHHKYLAFIPILLMTANRQISDEDSRSAGADKLIYKPLDLVQFLAKIESLSS